MGYQIVKKEYNRNWQMNDSGSEVLECCDLNSVMKCIAEHFDFKDAKVSSYLNGDSTNVFNLECRYGKIIIEKIVKIEVYRKEK